ncbi:PfkB family carbohydrate kinase [Cellulomonas fengjieae]|uniref:Carbohydrate kinase n=1 Tax=Cellulomonas fengjieae TaxID=2819978 RepID=A0ABS3SFS8_9CELL|nr:PfkB family carbohydrate kinase [Cellulomonas fengjieae]MBO3084612.1 carbohydrate kinase [Cellulomonas fengjieae]QVI67060.1 carbohydrate kinase [Cellulomonas fengjieae]
MTPLLVCCGLATLDVVQVVDRLPGPDEKVVARSLDVTFGGPAANAAATAAALGVRTVLVTALGAGPVAELVRAGLVAAGVEVVDLLAGPGAPAVSTVLVTRSTGERAVVSVNATGAGDLPAPDVDVLRDATALLVDGHHLGAAQVLARAASARGVPVLLDGGSWKPGLDDLLAHVDHAVVSADFRLPDDAPVDALLDRGPTLVAQSAGGDPVRVLRVAPGGTRTSDVLHPPTVPAGDVVDTLGAGDVLHGATAAALAAGHDILAALHEGVVRASESVRYPGALGWVSGPGRA